MKDLLDSKTTADLLNSALAEIAKSANELRCARNDLDKASNRINFLLVLVNKLIERQKD